MYLYYTFALTSSDKVIRKHVQLMSMGGMTDLSVSEHNLGREPEAM